MKIGAVLLCAGLSRRMGSENKLLTNINHKPMYAYAMELIDSCNFEKKVIVTAYDEIAQKAKKSGFNICYNYEGEKGQGLSVAIGTKNAFDMDGIAYFMGDQPFITKDIIDKLIETFIDTDKIVVPCCNGQRLSPCIFPKRFFIDLGNLCGEQGGRVIIKQNPDDVEYVEFSDINSFFDIDNRDDLKKLLI